MTALAEELGGWGKLDGHEAADTVQWTRRIRNQLALRLPISADTPPPTAKTFRLYPALAHFSADSTRARLIGRSYQAAVN